MARISLGLCLMLVVASSVIYEAQGHFLLKNYLKTQFPSKSNEFTPYVNRGLSELLTDLERFCPPTPEFKGFFTEFKSYMSFISSSSSKNVDMEMTKKADGLFRAMSAISGGAGQKSAEAGSFKSTMISMGKTLVEQKSSTTTITSTEKKTLVTSMVQWTKTIATVVKTASEQKGKKIDINSFGLDVDVNDKAIVSVSGSSHSSSSSTKTSSESSSKSSSYNARAEAGSSAKAKETTEKGEKKDEKKEKAEKKPEIKEEKKPEKKEEKKNEKDSSSATTKETSSTKAGASGSTRTGSSSKDTTGGSAGSPTAAKDKTSEKESGNAASSVKQQSNNAAASRGSASSMNQQQQQQSKRESASSSSTTSVTEIEKETSQETSSFISGLEKRYSQKAELKPFFEKLKASMTASSRVSSTKSAQEFTSTAKSTTGKLSDAMTFVGSRFSKSAEMKSNIETTQEKLMKSIKEFQDLNSKIVGEQKVSTTKETQIKQTMSKIEQVTTQFVETAASSSSSSQQSQQSQKQRTATSQQQTAASSQQQTAASSQQQNEQQNSMGRLKNN